MSKEKKSENYLDFIPMIKEDLNWCIEDGLVLVVCEHKGFLNTIAHKVFRMPKETKVYLDERGSFIWSWIDGKNSVYDISVKVKENYGEKADPLYYERLCQYFRILEAQKFVTMNRLQ